MTDDYYSEPPLRNLDRIDQSVVWDWLEIHFPSCGSKIDWSQSILGRHVYWKIDDDAQFISMALREICQRIRPGSGVEHVGDSLSPYGVRFTSDNAHAIVAALLEIPEHHYFLAEDRSWLVVATMEGYLDVVDELA